MIIRSDLDLPTLRILVDARDAPGSSEILFQAVRGRATPAEVARCRVSALGPLDATGALQESRSIALPDEVITALGDAILTLGPAPVPPANAMWLEFPAPRGQLYVLPWERLLAPLGRPFFRLPNHIVRPQAPGNSLDVAICSSAPQAKSEFTPTDLVLSIAERYIEQSGHDVRFLLFVDAEWHDDLVRQAADRGLAGRVVIPDPKEAASYTRRMRSSSVGGSSPIENPWLRWMLDAVSGRRLDVVHFATHGFLSGGRGAIAVANAPTENPDAPSARFIGSVELVAFLTQVGAWGLGLSGPPWNYSETGLRELADAVAYVHPGVVLTHSVPDDEPDLSQLGTALQTFLGQPADEVQPLPAVSAWVHPRFVEFPEEEQSMMMLNSDGSSAFISGSTSTALGDRETDAWVAGVTRTLEQLQARWLPSAEGEVADEAAVLALQRVSALLEDSVNSAYPNASAPEMSS
jgi:hypothetical protein